jgi:glycosyltransferase involved in cell wall biosynthesis
LLKQLESDQHTGPFTLSLVVPLFNEAATIDLFLDRVTQVFSGHPDIHLEMLFVNDGSTDSSLAILLTRQVADSRIKIIDLSRNFGKEAALTAGLHAAQGQVVVPIDIDMQDPPEVILDMVAKWREGYEVVLARRINRDSDSMAKRSSSAGFYWLHNKIAKPKLPENVGDFRLMDRCVVQALKQLPESRRFMKGLFAWVGFRTATVDYVRPTRSAGQSKFNGWQLWNFALEGITSFSIDPLRVWTYLGSAVALISFVFGLRILAQALIWGTDAPGYASLFVAVTFIGGLQLIGIGIIGEYLGRTYLEAKRRPSYLVRRVYTPNAEVSTEGSIDESTEDSTEKSTAGSVPTDRVNTPPNLAG